MEKFKDIDNYIKVNTKILFNVVTGDYRGVYDSRIEDIKNDEIRITTPTLKGVPFPVYQNIEVEVSFINEKGRFSFKTKVLGRIVDKIPLIQIQKPDFIFRKELRKYFRVGARLKIKFRNINYKLKNGQPDIERTEQSAIIKDISGGGFRFVTDATITEGQAMEVFEIEGIEIKNDVICRVVSIYNNADKTDAGAEYISIKELDRDKIIKYVFQRQIELRKMAK